MLQRNEQLDDQRPAAYVALQHKQELEVCMTTMADPLETRQDTRRLDIFRSILATVRTQRSLRRERARLGEELAQCSDRELAEMNLNRAEIPDIVRHIRIG